MNKNSRPIDHTRFERVGGSWQPKIENESDLRNILELDPAQWSFTSIDISKYSCDPEFLAFLDSDRDGKIRVDEVKAAIAWVLPRMKCFCGFEKGDSVLRFSCLKEETPEGAAILNAARFAMKNAGMPESGSISLEDIRDEKKLLAYGLANGDGVLPPEQVSDPELSAFASQIMALEGKARDISSADGIDLTIVNSFEDKAVKFLAWKKIPAEDPAVFFRGKDTLPLFAAFSAIREKMDEFFRLCQALSLADGSAAVKTPSSIDPLNTVSMENFMKNAPLAGITPEMKLDLDGRLNPLWMDPLRKFFSAYSPENRCVTMEDWNRICGKFIPCSTWISSKPCNQFDALDEDGIRKLQKDLDSGMIEKLRDLIEEDKSSGEHVTCFSQVRKLILFQKNLFEFLNNYVSLKELFSPEHRSMLQPGELIMDGRHFSLTTPVTNVAEHKKLSAESCICTMYVETTAGTGPALKKQSYAVAVTSGDMKHLFIGKCGIFITCSGMTLDAKVIDFIQQPVSISEAMKMPFYKFADLVGKQVDKFFSARSKEIETGVDKSFTQAQNYKPAVSPANTAATAGAAGKMQTPAVSGSMMLMGGGLGLAAIGSSFAFMAQALKNVSVWNVVVVFLCIVLIFSGPLVIMSLIKLYRRSISSFMEAGGIAVNKRMRLSGKMGSIFTRNPEMPLKRFLAAGDIVNRTFSSLVPRKHSKFLNLICWILILVMCILGVVLFCVKKDPAAVKGLTEKVLEKYYEYTAEVPTRISLRTGEKNACRNEEVIKKK